jgi:hypothetical protein
MASPLIQDQKAIKAITYRMAKYDHGSRELASCGSKQEVCIVEEVNTGQRSMLPEPPRNGEREWGAGGADKGRSSLLMSMSPALRQAKQRRYTFKALQLINRYHSF